MEIGAKMLKKIIFIFKRKELQDKVCEIKIQIQEFQIESEQSYKEEWGDEVLVITDQKEISDWCIKNKVAIIVFLHSENKDCDFFNVRYAIEDLDGIDAFYLNKVYKRCHAIPWKVLETRRYIVREMTEDDVEDLYDLYEEPAITLYLDNLEADRKRGKEYIENYINQVYHLFEYGMWVIEEKNSGRLIGRAGVEWKERSEGLEMGYVVAIPYQRQGVAYEVCSAIIDYIRKNVTLEPICILTHSNNEPSINLAEKLGFHFECIIEKGRTVIKKYIL